MGELTGGRHDAPFGPLWCSSGEDCLPRVRGASPIRGTDPYRPTQRSADIYSAPVGQQGTKVGRIDDPIWRELSPPEPRRRSARRRSARRTSAFAAVVALL